MLLRAGGALDVRGDVTDDVRLLNDATRRGGAEVGVAEGLIGDDKDTCLAVARLRASGFRRDGGDDDDDNEAITEAGTL